jgi:hypothetical protein
MELKVTIGEGQDTFIITEIIDGLDALDNPIKVKGESGQHTIVSIQGVIDGIDAQIEAAEQSKIKLVEYLSAINNFLNE